MEPEAGLAFVEDQLPWITLQDPPARYTPGIDPDGLGDEMKTWTKTLTVATIIMAAAAGVAQQETPASGGAIPEVRSANVEPASSAAVASQPSFQTRYPRYKLRPGDAFEISFELSPEFNQSVTVQPDGFITLRGIGDVHVAEQDVPQLTATLRTAYSKILHDPLISIVLKDFEKPYFIADGQVGR